MWRTVETSGFGHRFVVALLLVLASAAFSFGALKHFAVAPRMEVAAPDDPPPAPPSPQVEVPAPPSAPTTAPVVEATAPRPTRAGVMPRKQRRLSKADPTRQMLAELRRAQLVRAGDR